MATLNSVLKEGLLVDRRWFRLHGVGATAVDYYLRAGKIEAMSHGIYRKPGPPLKWQNIVYSLTRLDYNVHVGHLSALKYQGFEHYLKLGNSQSIRLYGTEKLPSWVSKVQVSPGFSMMKRNLFVDDTVGIIEVPFGAWDWPIRYSSAERAFLELADTIGTSEDIFQARMMLEGAANLRPRLLQELLESCCNIKAKRLFLWLSRTVGHSWFRHIDTSRIDMGAGKRQIIPGGKLDAEFMITVPQEIQNGQKESVF